MKIKNILISKGYKMYIDSPTNQQFVIMDNNKLRKNLKASCLTDFGEKYDENNTVIRFATSWATTDEQVRELESYYKHKNVALFQVPHFLFSLILFQKAIFQYGQLFLYYSFLET